MTGQEKLTFKLDFPGNLWPAASNNNIFAQKLVRSFEARDKSWFKKFAHTKDTFTLSCTCEPFSGISSGYYPPIEKYEYSDAFEKERSGEEVRTGGGWRMNARGGGHASPPPLLLPTLPVKGWRPTILPNLVTRVFGDIPIFQGVGRCHWGVHICLRILR